MLVVSSVAFLRTEFVLRFENVNQNKLFQSNIY